MQAILAYIWLSSNSLWFWVLLSFDKFELFSYSHAISILFFFLIATPPIPD
jgi:hypothetical protein